MTDEAEVPTTHHQDPHLNEEGQCKCYCAGCVDGETCICADCVLPTPHRFTCLPPLE